MKIRLMILFIGTCMGAYCIQSCAGGGESTGTDESAQLEEEGQIEDYECLSEDAKELLDDPDLDEEDRIWIEASGVCPPPPTTIDKIFAAEEAGTIDAISAHLYRLFAYLDPDQVDPQLLGAEVARGDSIVNMELQWLHDNFKSFSPEGQEKLMKFILPPPDPNSIFHPPVEITDAKIAKSTTDFMPMLEMESPGRWKIFYYPTWIDKAQQINDALETAWPIFKNFFRGLEPAEEVYVYIADIGEHDNGSNTMTVIDGAKRCKTCIHVDIKDDIIRRGTTVHELFHCFHEHLFLSLANTFYAPNHNSIAEAAAEFSEHLVYPGNNTEQYRLKIFFPSLNDNRLKFNGSHEYSTYMWLFFVNQQFGLDKVQEIIFQTAEVLDPRELFTLPVPDHDRAYADFAFFNLNHVPFNKYEDINGFPTHDEKKCGYMACTPKGKSLEHQAEEEPGKKTIVEELEPGGIRYYQHLIFGNKIKQVTVRYDAIDQFPNLNRRVAIYNDSTSDWKLLGDRNADGMDTFCLTKPEEKVEIIKIIQSNASMTTKYPLSYDIETSPECELKGKTTITMTTPEIASTFVSKDTIELVPDEDPNVKRYVLTERTMTYNSSNSWETFDPVTSIAMKFDTTCTGKLTETYTPEEDIIKFEIENEEMGIIYPYPDPYEVNWVTCTQAVITNGQEIVTTTQNSPDNLWPERSKRLDQWNIQSGRIKGEDTYANPAIDSESTIKFEYQR